MNNFSVLECPVYFDKTNMLDMLSLSAGRAILCQNRLGEQIIADNSWGLDPMKGMIRFGEREFRAGILGSESEIQNTWLWSWAHTESGLPESSTAVSRRVKKLLPELPEFQTGKFIGAYFVKTGCFILCPFCAGFCPKHGWISTLDML